MPRASNDGVELYYERDGRVDAEPVVFVQGVSFGRWMWRWQRGAFEREYAVIAPDNRGTGRSEIGLPGPLLKLPRKLRALLLASRFAYSIEGLAADLEAVLADADVDGVHLVGASLGGMIAQQYAIEYSRAKSLTLFGTSHGGPDAVSMPEDTRSQLSAHPGGMTKRQRLRHRMRPVFSERFTNRNPHLMDRIIEWRLEQDATEPASEAQLGAALSHDVTGQLDRIRVPTLICHGADDRVSPVANARLLHEKIPDSRLELFDDGSHLCFIESAGEATDTVFEFVEDVRDRPAGRHRTIRSN